MWKRSFGTTRCLPAPSLPISGAFAPRHFSAAVVTASNQRPEQPSQHEDSDGTENCVTNRHVPPHDGCHVNAVHQAVEEPDCDILGDGHHYENTSEVRHDRGTGDREAEAFNAKSVHDLGPCVGGREQSEPAGGWAL